VLQDRLSDIRKGRFDPPDARKLTLKNVIDDLLKHYEVNERRSHRRAASAVKHVTEFFGERSKVKAISTAALERYVSARKTDGVANATIRYELALARRGLNLKARAGEIEKVPAFPQLVVDNARTGFFEEGEYRVLLKHLPSDLQPVVTFAYWTGWRIRSEVLTLRWSQVDLRAGTVRLEPGTTKNKEGRTFPFDAVPELATVIRQQWRKAKDLEVVPTHVFFRESGRTKGGAITGDRYWRGAWANACAKGRLVGVIPHDFRRTAVRNLERQGVSRSVAMKLVGHKTEAMYRRYAIVSEGDLREGVAKLARVATTTPETHAKAKTTTVRLQTAV
jgi:integrase